MEGAISSSMVCRGMVFLTQEWDEFITYDWNSIYQNMYKPAFVFDGRNILDADVLNKIGFQFKGIGKG